MDGLAGCDVVAGWSPAARDVVGPGDALSRSMHGGGSGDVVGRVEGVTVTGCRRLWWRSWRWRWWVTGREKPSTPGNAECSAADGVVRRRHSTWPSAVDGANQRFGCG